MRPTASYAPLVDEFGGADKDTYACKPSQDLVDLVSAINMLCDRLPMLTVALERLREATPGMARDAILGRMTADRWMAMVTLLNEPAEILAGLAELCRHQAGVGLSNE
jgi:hypothetical protein